VYKAKSLILLAGLALLSGAIGLTLFGATAALFIMALVLGLNWLAVGRARAVILWAHRARALRPWEAPALHEMARDLAARAGVPQPQLMVYPADMPNAFAIGRGRDPGVVAVSTGLARLLSAREIRGVLAHEFAHLKNQDSSLSLAAGALVQVVGVLSQGFVLLMTLLLLTGGLAPTGLLPPGALLTTLLLVGAAPTGAAALQAGLMRTRERLADRDAAQLTGDPRGLASALHRIDQYSRRLGGWLRRFRFIYTSEGEQGSRWLRTHPTTAERVAALLGLEGGSQGALPAATRAPAARSRVVYRLVS